MNQRQIIKGTAPSAAGYQRVQVRNA